MANTKFDQWVDWLNNLSSKEEVPKIEWIIAVLPCTKKIYGRPYPGVKSWAHTLKALTGLFKKNCNLKSSLVFCPYHWPDGLKEFSGSSNI